MPILAQPNTISSTGKRARVHAFGWIPTASNWVVNTDQIEGYGREVRTHLQVAGAVAELEADVGLGIAAAVLAYCLGFVLLTTERYDLVITEEAWPLPGVQALVQWLNTAKTQRSIIDLGGYDVAETGCVVWVG